MKQRERKRKKVAFFGHFNSTNFGNESTLQAILCNLHRFQTNAEVTCISTGPPQGTVANYQIEAIPISEKFVKSWSAKGPLVKVIRSIFIGIPSEIYRWIKGYVALRHTDMLIIPGLGMLSDAFGLFAVGYSPYNLFKWSLIAKVCGCKLLFVSVGAGPIYTALGRFFIKSVLSLADFRSYRDNATKHCLSDIGFRAENDSVCPDLVFSLPEAMIPNHGAKKGKKSCRAVVGLGLMLYSEKYSAAGPSIDIQRAYLENLAVFVRWLLHHEYDVRLLIGDLVDLAVIQDFRDLLRDRSSQIDLERIIYEPISSVGGLLSQIAETDIVVATRFHNVLLSLLCDKPTIAISFHHKCESLMRAMGLSAYCLDIDKLKADTLIEKFCDLNTNADRLKPLVREKAGEYRKALDEQYQIIFKNICPR
jgi:polysaccharide pyruvyl transferase WcaK-like protein